MSARLTWLRRGVVAVLLAGVLAFLVQGADQPSDPVLIPAGEEAQARSGEAAAAPIRPRTPSDDAGTTTAPPSTSTTQALAPSPTLTAPSAPPAQPDPATAAVPAPLPVAPTTTTEPAPPPRRPLAGFGEVAFRITTPGSRTFDGFALLAADRPSQNQGLMEQTDLRGYDAMVFRYDRPSTGTYYMRNTRIPLSIAFFDSAGRFVSSTDMVPCPDAVEDCPTYASAGPYTHAIEVAAGDLPRMGIGPGALLSFPR